MNVEIIGFVTYSKKYNKKSKNGHLQASTQISWKDSDGYQRKNVNLLIDKSQLKKLNGNMTIFSEKGDILEKAKKPLKLKGFLTNVFESEKNGSRLSFFISEVSDHDTALTKKKTTELEDDGLPF